MGGLLPTKFLFSPSKYPPSNMAELMLRAQKHMNTEDAMTTRRDEGNELHEPSKRKRDERPKIVEGEARLRDNANRGSRLREAHTPTQRAQVYAPLNSTLEQVFMYVRDDPALKWPN